MDIGIEIPAATYSAFRGYAWSHIPVAAPEDALDRLLRLAEEARAALPNAPGAVRGCVSDGRLVAPFALFTAPGWDCEGRDSDYAALAVLTVASARLVDFVALLADPFFSVPTRNPPEKLAYAGPASSAPPVDAAGRLLCRGRLDDFDPRAAGALLSAYGRRADRWQVVLSPEGGACVSCGPWRHAEEAK